MELDKEENKLRVRDWLIGKIAGSDLNLNDHENRIALAEEVFEVLNGDDLLTGNDF